MNYSSDNFVAVFVVVFYYLSSVVAVKANAISCTDTSPECLKKYIKVYFPKLIQGIPEIGVGSLDPFVVDKLELTLPGDLRMEIRNGLSRGLKKCHVDFARLNGNIFEMQIKCNLTIKGKYKSSGRMLMFPINGDGDCMIKCKNIRINGTLELGSKVGEDGQKYFEMKHVRISHGYEDKVSYHITNLFKGNPEISKVVLNFMNDNWRLVAEEFGDPIVEFGVTSVLNSVKKLFEMVPMKQLVEDSGVNFFKKL